MSPLSVIIKELKDICSSYCVLLIIAIGLFAFFVDRKALISKNYKKDAKIAKVIGIVYMLVLPIFMLIIKFV